MKEKFRALALFWIGAGLLIDLGAMTVQSPEKPVWVEPTTYEIFLDPATDKDLLAASKKLASSLKECSGLDFTVNTSSSYQGKGILLSVKNTNTSAEVSSKLSSLGPEGVWICGTEESLQIIGNTPLAVRNGIQTYLHELGFRFYFPHPAWHILPKTKKLFAKFSILTHPDFEQRKFGRAFSRPRETEPYNQDKLQWIKDNRMETSVRYSFGHAWDDIIRRWKEDFEKHPEYLATRSNETSKKDKPNTKLCPSHEGLVQICIKDAFQRIENPKDRKTSDGEVVEDVQMISMESSDGPGYCVCAACQKNFPTCSDQVYYLANRVAQAIREKHPNILVGVYAYNDHVAPPSFPVEPNIYISLAQGYNLSKYSYDELLKMWKEKLAPKRLGIREYYSVVSSNHEVPGVFRGSRTDYIAATIPKFHQAGVVAMQTESCDGALSKGLGEYVGARLLWDAEEDATNLQNEFYAQCFGSTQKPMEELFRSMQANRNRELTSHDLGKWLRMVCKAEGRTDDAAIRTRIDHVKYYLHYLVLLTEWKTHAGSQEELVKKHRDLMSYIYRIRNLGVIANHALYRRLAHNKAPSPENRWNSKNCSWKKNDSPVSSEELNTAIAGDITRHKEVEGLHLVDYATTYKAPDPGSSLPEFEAKTRLPSQWIVQIPPGGDVSMQATFGNVIKSEKMASIKFYGVDQEIDEEEDVPLAEFLIPCDLKAQPVNLKQIPPGTYLVQVHDNKAGAVFKFGRDVKYSILADPQNKLRSGSGRTSYYFYVPKGTKRFALVSDPKYSLVTGRGETLTLEKSRDPLRVIDVSPGDEGIWTLTNPGEGFYFMGIPPMVSASARQLLVPTNAAP